MIRNVFALIVAASLALSVFDLSAHAQNIDQFKIGKAAYDANKFEIAFKTLKPLAERGHAEAQLIIADMYNLGRGVRQDNSLAISWYRKSAEQGNTDAIQMLGQGMRLFGESSAN
jgi:TPR repeat protein